MINAVVFFVEVSVGILVQDVLHVLTSSAVAMVNSLFDKRPDT